MKLLRKILLLLVLFLLAAAAAGTAAVLWKRHQVIRSGGRAKFLGTASVKQKEIPLGEKFQVKLLCRIPWGTSPETVVAEPGKGLQLTGTPQIRRVKYFWGHNLYEISAGLQAYQLGELKCGTVSLLLSPAEELSQTLPDVKISDPPDCIDELQAAGPYEEPFPLHHLLWLIPVFLLIAGGVITWLVLRKRKKERSRIIPPWEQAISAISELLDHVRKGRIAPETSLARLTDIVRQYLEQRFQLRAEHQTTPEFLQDMERGKSAGILPEDQKCFLKDFLNAAELVKFAGLPADTTLFEDAAEKAGRLIQETIPAEEEKEKKQ